MKPVHLNPVVFHTVKIHQKKKKIVKMRMSKHKTNIGNREKREEKKNNYENNNKKHIKTNLKESLHTEKTYQLCFKLNNRTSTRK